LISNLIYFADFIIFSSEIFWIQSFAIILVGKLKSED